MENKNRLLLIHMNVTRLNNLTKRHDFQGNRPTYRSWKLYWTQKEIIKNKEINIFIENFLISVYCPSQYIKSMVKLGPLTKAIYGKLKRDKCLEKEYDGKETFGQEQAYKSQRC